MDDEDSQDEQIINNSALRKGKRHTPVISDCEEDEEEDDEEGTEDTVGALDRANSKIAKSAAPSSDEDTDNCPICLNAFRDQVVGTPENCSHYFCLDCILEWSKNASSCPVDRITFSCICIRAHFGGKVLKKVPVENRSAQDDEEDDITNCQVCGRSDREDRLLLCDGCDAGYHMECLVPPLSAVPVDEWFCPQCEEANLPTNETDSLSDHEAAIPQPRVATSSSGHRMDGMRTRAIARTRQSERVRATVNQIRIRTAQQIQHVPQHLSLLDETIDAVIAGLNTAVYQRPLASGTTANWKAKTGRRKKARSKKKTQTKSGSRSTSTGKRTRKHRRRRKGRKLKLTKEVTVRSRIAKTLGLCKPVRGVSIPAVQRAVEPSLGFLRADIGAASLSVFGDPYELDPFDSNEEHPVSPASPLSTKRRVLSRSALRSHQPVARPISVGLSRSVAAPIREAAGEPAPLPDLLGSILTGQNILMMNSSDIIISRDGSLLAKNPACLSERSLSSESRNGDMPGYSLTPGPVPSRTGVRTLTAEMPKPVVPASVNRFPSSTSLFLPRGLERAVNPMARSLGSTATRLQNVIRPRISQPQNSTSMRKLDETSQFNGDSKQLSNSFPIAPPNHNTASRVKSSVARSPPKPSARLDISELPRIPKIKREENGEHPEHANGKSNGGIPNSCINHLTGKEDSSQPSRFSAVQNSKSGSRESQEQHSHAGEGSTFTSNSASGGSASHTSGGARVLEAQSGGGFRITISGNAGHSSRLFSPSSYDPFRTTDDKAQQKPSTPSCVNSNKKEKPVKSEIYDPFDPTGSDSSSAHSSPERVEPQATVSTNSSKIGAFRSFRFFTTMPKIGVSRLGPVFSDAPSPSPPRSTELRSDSALKQIIIERSTEPVAEKMIKVENDHTDEENNHITASCMTRTIRLTPELEHFKAKITEGTISFPDAAEPGNCSLKAEPNPKTPLSKDTQLKTEKHQRRRTESPSPSHSNSSSRSQKKPKKEKKSLTKGHRKTPSRSHSRERSSRSASWSTEEDRSKKTKRKFKSHRASSGHSSSSSRERSKKKKIKEKKAKSSWAWERKRSRSGSPSSDYYHSRKKKKRRSRSYSRGRDRSWSSSEERAKRRKHKRERSHDRYDKRESGSRGRERWRSRSRDRKRPRSRSHSREHKRAKSRDRWLRSKERYAGVKDPHYSPHRKKVVGTSMESTSKYSSTKLQVWHPSVEQVPLQAKSKQKASGVVPAKEMELKESVKVEEIGDAFTSDSTFVKTESTGSQGSPEPFVSPTQWELVDDSSSTHPSSLYDSILTMSTRRTANRDSECEAVAGYTVEKEETWLEERDMQLNPTLPKTETAVMEDKERALETAFLDTKKEVAETAVVDIEEMAETGVLDMRGEASETALFDVRGEASEIELFDERGGAVETEPFDVREGAAETEPFDVRGGAAETEPFDVRGGAAETEPFDVRGGAAETEPFDVRGEAAETEPFGVRGEDAEASPFDVRGEDAEASPFDVRGEDAEASPFDVPGEDAEASPFDVPGEDAEASPFDVPGEDAEASPFDVRGEDAEASPFDVRGEDAEASPFDVPGEDAEASPFDVPGEDAEASPFDVPGEDAEASPFDVPGEDAEAALFDVPGEAAEAALFDVPGEAAETAMMEDDDETLGTTVTSIIEEKEVASETSMMEWEEELLGIAAMNVKEEGSMIEEEEGKMDLHIKKSDLQSFSQGSLLKSKTPVKRVTWNLRDEESDTIAAEKTARGPLHKLQRAREVPWKMPEMSSPMLNQVYTQNSPLALPLPVIVPPYAPVSEPTVQFIMQGSLPLLTGGAGASLTPEPGSLVTASEPGAEAASAGETENKDRAPRQIPEKMKNEEYLKKLYIQERAVEEVKLAIKPFYQKREITKEEYKDILRKAVQKICHSKSGEINPVKVANLVKAYVERYKHMRKYKKSETEEDQESEHQMPA
ncbi:PHD and RING finger domain-containing protein 1 isoform X2 [Rhinatrema bivittatum]|uniref:PHD and RING finger domain-containing protein 1 isoform X2 n=1 Tax=Rhinatrema bivittatum TaxID=194408 RepID=UPI00112ED5D8|nr:PHD and RING finger domain-containing protein 1 isoform X2 [Rhinatrema bivittatum]XP_029438801.1 PHD and RING finger domain-containing protein 1 isoform X2 [Rhinatrema bivittatum]XP_029438802.1 PHD and RING finger domain-containing protein 1 isoform X2 [Rhinatrema bivittatum]